MIELLQQPSTVVTAFAVALLLAVVISIRSIDRLHPSRETHDPAPEPEPGAAPPLPCPGLNSTQRFVALGCSMLAIVVSVVATMVDARWFGHDEYRLVAMPAGCLVVGCALGSVAALRASVPERSGADVVVQFLLVLFAFGLVGCGGLVMSGLALG